MKLKLIATLIGLAIAGGAHAAIDQSATGNGELFFQLWSDNGTSSVDDDTKYVRDLGSLLSNGGSLDNWASAATTPVLAADKLVSTPSPLYSLAADATLTSFLSGTTDLSSLRWSITAVDSKNTDRFLTTSSGIEVLPTYTEFRVFATATDSFLAKTTSIGSGTSVVLTGAQAGVVSYANNVAGKAKFTTDGGLNDELNFYLLYEKAASGTGTAFMSQYADASGNAATWSFNNDGALTYAVASVPEPESYALFLAGLGMIGAIARRRLAKKQ